MTISSYNIKKVNSKLDSLIKALNGGEGSGNFRHGGRPGQVGGSSSTGGSGTKSDKALFESVKQMADIFSSMNKREGYKYSSSEDLVLKQGKFFTPETRPADVKLGAKKECFSNAARLALERSNLTYVEGYAMINDGLPLPIAHAWCVDKKGRVVDNTWEKPGVAYFGVPFKTSYLAKKLSETGVYGILSGSVGSSDFLKDGVPSDWIADIKKQKNSYEPSIKDRLNNLIYKMNEATGKRGNPYHDEKGRFTFGPAGVSASFYEPKDYYTRPDVKTTVGTFDMDHDGYLVVKERGKYVMENLIDKNVKLDDEFTKKNLENLTKQEISSLTDYTNEHGGINYSQVNKYMRTGEGSDEVKQAAKNISSALEKSRVGGEGMVFRGIDASVIGGKRLEVDLKKLRTGLKKGTIKDATKILKTTNDLIGQTFTDKAPMSTNAKYSSSYGQRDVVLAINVKKDTKGLDITSLSSYGHGKKDAWTEKFGSAINFENEVLLSPNTTLKFKKVTLDDKGVIIECDIESQK